MGWPQLKSHWPKFVVPCTNNVIEKEENLFHHDYVMKRNLLYLKDNNAFLFT